jgi:hypothetical protein
VRRANQSKARQQPQPMSQPAALYVRTHTDSIGSSSTTFKKKNNFDVRVSTMSQCGLVQQLDSPRTH